MNLADELVAVGGWAAVLAGFLVALGSTGQVGADQNSTTVDTNNIHNQLAVQKKQWQKQQLQIQLMQLQQELKDLELLVAKKARHI